MQPIITSVQEPHYPGRYDALRIVAAEKKYLAMTEPPPYEQSVAFCRFLDSKGFPNLVALDGAQVVGWCDVSPQFGQTRAHTGSLGMGLLPAYRHQGLGSALLQAALTACWQRGLTRVELQVRDENHNARRLYERLGFQWEGTLRQACRVDGVYSDLHLMALLNTSPPATPRTAT